MPVPKIAVHPDNIPVSGREIASLPNEDRRSVQKTADFIQKQYTSGLSRRRQHAVAWKMIWSFLSGAHHFRIDKLGRYSLIDRREGEIRETVPYLRPWYRQAQGLLASNKLGVTVPPLTTNTEALYKAHRTEALLNWWLEEMDVATEWDRANQILLSEGMVGYYVFPDEFKQNVVFQALPSSQLFPLPWDASSGKELSGLIWAKMVTRSWLELQDEIFEAQTGRPPKPRMADEARGFSHFGLDFPVVTGSGLGGKFEGALVRTVWMNETEKTPGGEYLFLVNDRVFRQAIGTDEQGELRTRSIMPGGRIPVEFVYFDRRPDDFWGISFLEPLLGAQLALDRQMTFLSRSVQKNRPWTFVNPDSVNLSDLQNEDAPIIPLKRSAFSGDESKPVLHFPATSVGGDTAALLNLSQTFGDAASGFRSGLVFGQQEGRTEGGPATSILAQNALAPLVPTLRRMDRALVKTYKRTLDLGRMVWPSKKLVRILGPTGGGREFTIQQSEVPWSEEVNVQSQPLVPGGVQTLLSILFNLRTIPGADGKQGTEINSREFRNALARLGLLPPGVELENRAANRIQTRINLLIGDGQRPTFPATDISSPGRMIAEDHRLSIEMITEVMLDDTVWLGLSSDVQENLKTQLRFHTVYAVQTTEHPDSFDDDLDKVDSARTEQAMSLAESDLFTAEGEFSAAPLQPVTA
jgi:hypothetical protein